MNVPFLDLKAQYKQIKDEVKPEIDFVLDNTCFILGPKVKEFEGNFAKYCGVKHCLGVNSGTDALTLALKAIGIKQGDEIIIPANTFVATAESVSHCGAIPVLVDMDKHTYLINPELIEQKITKKTRAIIPVHLYGQMCDMDKIMNIAKQHNLFVIEDSCQSHGAEFKGKKAGSIGHLGCFSFYPGKNLGAYGEGGAITTNSDEYAEAIIKLRDHGAKQKYYHDIIGFNSRLHGIQGAVLNVKLRHLDSWNNARIKNARLYEKHLKGSKIFPAVEHKNGKHIYHLYVVQIPNRDEAAKQLNALGVQTGIHYPIPIHLSGAYSFLNYEKGDFPETEKAADKILSLPMFPELTEEQIKYVCYELKRIVG